LNEKEFISFIVDKVDDMKAKDIKIIDVSEKSDITSDAKRDP
jgi:ribosomal silencing factor RsfS